MKCVWKGFLFSNNRIILVFKKVDTTYLNLPFQFFKEWKKYNVTFNLFIFHFHGLYEKD